MCVECVCVCVCVLLKLSPNICLVLTRIILSLEICQFSIVHEDTSQCQTHEDGLLGPTV